MSWRTAVGWGLVTIGLGLVFVNLLQPVVDRVPGATGQRYLLGGLVIAGVGLWWVALFDRRE